MKLRGYLLTHRDHEAAIAAPAPHHAVHAPRSPHRHERRVQIALHLHRDLVHLQSDQSRRIAPPVDVRLVARHVGIVHDRRISDHGVHHRCRREVRLPGRRSFVHAGHRPRRRHEPVLAAVDPFGEFQAGFDRVRELVFHAFGKVGIDDRWMPKMEEMDGRIGEFCRRGKEDERIEVVVDSKSLLRMLITVITLLGEIVK